MVPVTSRQVRRGALALALAAALAGLAGCGGSEEALSDEDTDIELAEAQDDGGEGAQALSAKSALGAGRGHGHDHGHGHWPWPWPWPGPRLPACAAPPNPLKTIVDVQGPGEASPLAGQAVTVRGVVIGDFQDDAQLRGFFIQQPVADRDPATSEGLYVFAPGATGVSEGDYVQVSGVVAEFPGTDPAADRVTQIANPTAVTVCGAGPRIEPRLVRLPLAAPTDLERVENMRVRFVNRLTVTETFNLGRFGEIVLSAGGRLYQANNGSDPRTPQQMALSTIVLDDGSNRQYPSPTPYFSAPGADGVRRLGDTVRGLQGVLTQAFGAYRVHPTTAPRFQPGNPRTAAPPALGGTLKVASLNVLNYFTTLDSRGADTAAELVRQRDKIVSALQAMDADVVGLIEIQNDNGTALNDLVAALNARLGTPAYAALNSPRTGTDEIRVAVIYKPAAVRPLGAPRIPTDPRFVVDGGLRPPLAQRFAAVANEGGFWFIVNHFKSKGSCPGSGDVDQGQGCWNLARTVQAQALNDYAAGLAAASGEADVLMMGDFNAYLKEDPIHTIKGAGFEDLIERLPVRDRYSYVFEGQAGVLDHGFASASLQRQVTGVSVWHINADEPTVIDYNTEDKTDDRYAPTPYRASDHDPVLVGLNLDADPHRCEPSLAATLPAAATAGQPVQVTGIAAQACGGSALAALVVDWGDGSPLQALALDAVQAEHTYAAAGRYTVRVRATDNADLSAEVAGELPVAAAPGGGEADLIISEYVEGTSNNKALELYNAGAVAVNLGDYTLRLYNNGAAAPNTSLPLSGTLAPGSTLVIAHPSAGAALLARAQVTSGVCAFNGDDAIVLEKSGSVVDAIGQVGFDPGTQWSAGGVGTLDRTIRRKAGVTRGDAIATDAFEPSLEWDGFPIDDFSGLGSR
jgi:predicted extracellular nuclease